MKTKKLLVLLMTALLVIPLSAKDKKVVMQTDNDHVMHIEKFLGDPLDLTEEQEKAFKKLDLELKKATLTTRNELEIKELELEAELEENTPNEKKIYALVDDVYALKADVEKKEIASRLKKRALLDDEQKKAFDQMRVHHKNIIIRKGECGEDIDILMDHSGLDTDAANIRIEKKIVK